MTYLEYLTVAAICALAWGTVCFYRKIKMDNLSVILLLVLSMAWPLILPCVLGWNALHWVPSKIKALFEPEDHQ